MKPRDVALVTRINAGFDTFSRDRWPLPGIEKSSARDSLVRQLVDSVHRVEYVRLIRTRPVADERADPADLRFDPLKAALVMHRSGHADEAFWLIFLLIHFGKHPKAGWRYVREVYGSLGGSERWDWARTSAAPGQFRAWLSEHNTTLMRKDVPRGFGNHR